MEEGEVERGLGDLTNGGWKAKICLIMFCNTPALPAIQRCIMGLGLCYAGVGVPPEPEITVIKNKFARPDGQSPCQCAPQ